MNSKQTNLALERRIINLNRHLHGLLIETGLVQGLGIVDFVVHVVWIVDGKLLIGIGSIYKVLKD